MKILKTLLSATALAGIVLLWSGCQKEVSKAPVENLQQSSSSQLRLSGAIPDDPIALSKVPVIMSSDYLSEKQNILFRTDGRGGSRDRTKPTISITSPANGATVSGTISVTVNAADNIGVTSVTLYIDGSTTAVAGTSIAPFTNTWNTGSVINGTHTITATASDAAGNKASSSVSVNVNNVSNADLTSPTISITSPANNSSFDPNTNITISANASDNVGVTSIAIKIDNVLVGTGSGSTYSYTWNTSASGPHTIEARAYDAAGNQGYQLITVTINTTIITPPATLPSSFSLTMPPIMVQGSEGSCMAMAVINARSFEQYNRTNASSYSQSTNILSPEFLFNLTKADQYCNGSGLLNSLNLLVNTGVCTWASMPYTDAGCSLLPTAAQYSEAANYKIASYSKVLVTDQTAIKTMIASKRALVSQYTIDDNFKNAGPGYIWNSFSTNASFHALALCGYDDSKHAYLAVNAWGTGWGSAGYIWIDYDFLTTVSSDLFVMNF